MPPLMEKMVRRPRMVLTAVLLSSTILAGVGLAGGAFAEGDVPPPVNAQAAASFAPQAGFAPLVRAVKPAVVNIATTELPDRGKGRRMMPPDFPFPDMFRHYFGGQDGMGGGDSEDQADRTPEHALGSGFIIDPAGYIVTNNHVIDGAHKITVTLDDGSSHPAKIIGHDPKTDIALLKIEAGKTLPYVKFGSSAREEVGDWVVAVGNPFGLGGSVTAGIVSAHGRNINEGPYDDFLQIDAPINPGNSGGPLFNQAGEVIGIDTAIYSPNGGSVGIGFAIPSDLAAHVVAQLKDHGRVDRGWLGVQMQPLTPALAKAVGLKGEDGVLINAVLPDTPAAKSKLQQGDVVTAFNGKPVKSTRDLAVAVADTKAGQTVPVTVWRDGHEATVMVTLAEQSKETADAGNGGSEGGAVGLALAPLSNEDRNELGLPPSAHGVLVAGVKGDSLADESGLRRGDIIVSVAGAPVSSPAQAVERIHEAQSAKKEAVPLLVTRNGTTYYLALQLANS